MSFSLAHTLGWNPPNVFIWLAVDGNKSKATNSKWGLPLPAPENAQAHCSPCHKRKQPARSGFAKVTCLRRRVVGDKGSREYFSLSPISLFSKLLTDGKLTNCLCGTNQSSNYKARLQDKNGLPGHPSDAPTAWQEAVGKQQVPWPKGRTSWAMVLWMGHPGLQGPLPDSQGHTYLLSTEQMAGDQESSYSHMAPGELSLLDCFPE